MEYFERKRRQQEYLNTIKAGDVVHVSSTYDIYKLKVTKATKNQIVTQASWNPDVVIRFRILGGQEINKNTSYPKMILDPAWAEEMKEAKDKEIRRRNLLCKLEATTWGRLDVETLQKISDFIDKETKKNETL